MCDRRSRPFADGGALLRRYTLSDDGIEHTQALGHNRRAFALQLRLSIHSSGGPTPAHRRTLVDKAALAYDSALYRNLPEKGRRSVTGCLRQSSLR